MDSHKPLMCSRLWQTDPAPPGARGIGIVFAVEDETIERLRAPGGRFPPPASSPSGERECMPNLSQVRRPPLRSVRPSLLDLRFTGDPWMADRRDGTASLCLDDYRLAQIGVLSLDVPSFYRSLLRMRQRQACRECLRRRAQATL